MRASLDLKEVSYQMGDQEDEEAQPKVKTEGVSIKDAVKRAEAMKVDHRANESAIAKREANQKELAEKKKQDMLDRVKATEMGAGMSSTPARTKKVMAYPSPADFPQEQAVMVGKQLHVDSRAEALLVPLNGLPVPFHISMIKNVSRTEEDEKKVTVLRINFFTPSTAAGCLHKMDPSQIYIKELVYRSVKQRPGQSSHLDETWQRLNQLKKEYAQKDARRRAEAESVPQEDLKLSRGRQPPPVLKMLQACPPHRPPSQRFRCDTCPTHAHAFRTLERMQRAAAH
jgi:nucleosome binding factor SPN SPT16 subunit